MKRLIAVICVILLVSVTFTALASGINLAEMSYDELVDLKEKLVLELMERPETKVIVVPNGTWIVGQHIPAGEYSISTDDSCMIKVYKNTDTDSISNYESGEFLSDDDTIGRLVLADGMAVVISSGDAIFTKFTGLEF